MYRTSTMTSAKMKPPKTIDNDLDRFLKESCKSYKECSIKNTARRNSLQKKTLGIESEKRIASAKLSREEKQLRENLRQMNIEKVKNHILHNKRDPKPKLKDTEPTREPLVIPLEPYPITFGPPSPPAVTDIDKYLDQHGQLYSARRGRRVSKEFEDLTLPSRSKSFLSDELGTEPHTRRRVYSMSHAQSLQSRKDRSRSGHASPRMSPDLRRKVLGSVKAKKGSNSSGSRESISDSISSLEELHWVGEPEAIHSIRRPRKTVEEQDFESELHRLHIH